VNTQTIQFPEQQGFTTGTFFGLSIWSVILSLSRSFFYVLMVA